MVTTKGGDKGQSSLYNGDRLPKDDLIFQVLGDIDELNSHIGVLKAHITKGDLRKKLSGIQQMLLQIGGLIATPPGDPLFDSLKQTTDRDIEELEKWEKSIFSKAKLKAEFILPGETANAAFTDVCRSVCRRSERSLVNLINQRRGTHLFISCKYLNRLSDYFFILARYIGVKNI